MCTYSLCIFIYSSNSLKAILIFLNDVLVGNRRPRGPGIRVQCFENRIANRRPRRSSSVHLSPALVVTSPISSIATKKHYYHSP
jgi:hypothetical protein